jgi:hypothetical protein
MSEPGFTGLNDDPDLKNHGNPVIKKIIVQTSAVRLSVFRKFWSSVHTGFSRQDLQISKYVSHKLGAFSMLIFKK